MHLSGSLTIRRALFMNGTFCLVGGPLLAISASWLEGELPVASALSIAVAGVVTAVWGALLLVASRIASTRNTLGVVAVVNILVVVALLVWLLLEGREMTGIGLAVTGVIVVAVVRFAVYQSMLLRQ
jgi:hypothetical protein